MCSEVSGSIRDRIGQLGILGSGVSWGNSGSWVLTVVAGAVWLTGSIGSCYISASSSPTKLVPIAAALPLLHYWALLCPGRVEESAAPPDNQCLQFCSGLFLLGKAIFLIIYWIRFSPDAIMLFVSSATSNFTWDISSVFPDFTVPPCYMILDLHLQISFLVSFFLLINRWVHFVLSLKGFFLC